MRERPHKIEEDKVKSSMKIVSQAREMKRMLVVCLLIGVAALLGGPVLQRQATYVQAASPQARSAVQNTTAPMGPFNMPAAATNPQDAGSTAGSSKLPAASKPKIGHSEKNDTSPALR